MYINNYYLFIFVLWDQVPQYYSSCPHCNEPVRKPQPQSAFGYNRTINVKTVLFTHADSCKVCWSLSELNLLVARRLMQDLIPKRIPKDFSALLCYVQNCIGTVKSKTSGAMAQLMLSALYDALGGYLHSVALPVLNEAYYAGNVDYSVTSSLHYYLSQMMNFLGTNGASWANPCDMSRIPTKVSSLPITMCAEEEACNIFVLLEHKHKKPHREEFNEENNESMPLCTTGELKIQIPFLDDNAYPSAIAVPLKDHALFSLFSECSINIIPKYYIMAMRCLGSSRYTKKDIVVFNHHLHYWLLSTVVPHLNELDRWYPGFGGIMRVIETMNRRGLASNDPVKPNVKPLKINYTNCFGKEACDMGLISLSSKSRFLQILWIILIIIVVLILLFLLFCCLRCLCAKRYKNKSDVNTLVSLYCGLREPSNQDDEDAKHKSKSKTYESVTSYSATTSGEGSD